MGHLTAGQKLGKYEIIRTVGSSNAVVYEAWDPILQRRVAIKDLTDHLNGQHSTDIQADILARFSRELEIMGRLVHPNIILVFDGGFHLDQSDPGRPVERPYIVMEFLEGPSLGRISGQVLPVQKIVEIVEQLLSALECAHQAGIVHRDIKPDNIQILPGDKVKLMDFGISSLVSRSRITRTGLILGTLHYLSPEQAMGQGVDHRTDLFAVGIIVFELASGLWPFHGATDQETLAQIINATPNFDSIVHPDLKAFLKRALQKTPSMRFQSASEMRAALVALIGQMQPQQQNQQYQPPPQVLGMPFNQNLGVQQGAGPNVRQGGPQIIMPPPPPIPPKGFWPLVWFWTKRIVIGFFRGLWVALKWLYGQFKNNHHKQHRQAFDFWPLVTLGLGTMVIVKTCGFFADYGTKPREPNQATIIQSDSQPSSSTPSNQSLKKVQAKRQPKVRSSAKNDKSHVVSKPPKQSNSHDKVVETLSPPRRGTKPTQHEQVPGVDYPAPRVKHPDDPPIHSGDDN